MRINIGVRREDNIKTNIQDIKLFGRNPIGSAQEKNCWMALENMKLNIQVLYATQLISLFCSQRSYVTMETIWKNTEGDEIINMDLKLSVNVMNWLELSQDTDRLISRVNAGLNLLVT